MHRLKLYNKLGIQYNAETPCCLDDLESNDDGIEVVENCYSESNCLDVEEKSALFYNFGYIAYKEELGVTAHKNADNTDSEFLTNVSRGKLSYPP